MLKKLSTAALLLSLSLSACSHSEGTYVQQPPVKSAPPSVASSSPAAAPTAAASNQTYSDTGWSLSVPSNFVRKSADDTAFAAISPSKDLIVLLDIQPSPGNDLASIEMGALMQMTVNGINVDNGVEQKFAGYDGFVFTGSQPAKNGAGNFHLKGYVTVSSNYLFGLTCIMPPSSSNLIATTKTCDDVANSIVLTPSALPTVVDERPADPTPAPSTKK